MVRRLAVSLAVSAIVVTMAPAHNAAATTDPRARDTTECQPLGPNDYLDGVKYNPLMHDDPCDIAADAARPEVPSSSAFGLNAPDTDLWGDD